MCGLFTAALRPAASVLQRKRQQGQGAAWPPTSSPIHRLQMLPPAAQPRCLACTRPASPGQQCTRTCKVSAGEATMGHSWRAGWQQWQQQCSRSSRQRQQCSKSSRWSWAWPHAAGAAAVQAVAAAQSTATTQTAHRLGSATCARCSRLPHSSVTCRTTVGQREMGKAWC